MNNLQSFVEDYFHELGIKRYKNILQFWSSLDEEYGLTRARQLESAYIKLEDGDQHAFYSTIFEEFDVALAFSSLRIDLYKEFLSWFSEFLEAEKKKNATIIDVGCGNGILTCLIAKAFPEAEVRGFDISSQGVACADILKKKLELSNVEFSVHDVNSPGEDLLKKKAGIIISVASLDPEPGSRFDTNLSIQAKWSTLNEMEATTPCRWIASIKSLLDDDGVFISFDKVVTADEQLHRINRLEKEGLSLDFESSQWITYQDIQSEMITLPVVVARKDSTSGPSSELQVASFLMERTFSPEGIALVEKQEIAAELTFTYMNPKVFLRGARADYRDGTGSVWHEVWQAGPVLLTFEHTNHGYRGLKIDPGSKLSGILKSHESWIDSSAHYADIETLEEPQIRFEPSQSEPR